jgi:hypothetical protein
MNKIMTEDVLSFEGPYKFVCTQRPKDFSYYQKYDIKWSDLAPYHINQKLGRGKYSEVYLGANT